MVSTCCSNVGYVIAYTNPPHSSSRSTNHYDVNLFTCNTPGVYLGNRSLVQISALTRPLSLFSETICSKDEYGGVCVLNPSARPKPGNRKRSTLPASWSEEPAKFARAARAVTHPDDEELDL